MLIIVVCIMALTGLIMFAYFGNCDPMVTSKVTRPDQVSIDSDQGRTPPDIKT